MALNLAQTIKKDIKRKATMIVLGVLGVTAVVTPGGNVAYAFNDDHYPHAKEVIKCQTYHDLSYSIYEEVQNEILQNIRNGKETVVMIDPASKKLTVCTGENLARITEEKIKGVEPTRRYDYRYKNQNTLEKTRDTMDKTADTLYETNRVVRAVSSIKRSIEWLKR